MKEIFEFNIEEIKDFVREYVYIIDITKKIVLIEYTGILPLIKDILGNNIVEMTYFVIPFQHLYYFNFSEINFNTQKFSNHTIFLSDSIVIKLCNGNYVCFSGLMELLHINNYNI